jgi:hypothetical protein
MRLVALRLKEPTQVEESNEEDYKRIPHMRSNLPQHVYVNF